MEFAKCYLLFQFLKKSFARVPVAKVHAACQLCYQLHKGTARAFGTSLDTLRRDRKGRASPFPGHRHMTRGMYSLTTTSGQQLRPMDGCTSPSIRPRNHSHWSASQKCWAIHGRRASPLPRARAYLAVRSNFFHREGGKLARNAPARPPDNMTPPA